MSGAKVILFCLTCLFFGDYFSFYILTFYFFVRLIILMREASMFVCKICTLFPKKY